MAKVTFNVLVIYTIFGEVLETLVGTPITVLNELKSTTHYETMLEEYFNAEGDEDFPKSNHDNAPEFLQNMSDLYENADANDTQLVIRIKYFPNKTYQYKTADL